MTGLEKPTGAAIVIKVFEQSQKFSPMDDRPALRLDVAVGEALRGVARDVLSEARSRVEQRALRLRTIPLSVALGLRCARL